MSPGHSDHVSTAGPGFAGIHPACFQCPAAASPFVMCTESILYVDDILSSN